MSIFFEYKLTCALIYQFIFITSISSLPHRLWDSSKIWHHFFLSSVVHCFIDVFGPNVGTIPKSENYFELNSRLPSFSLHHSCTGFDDTSPLGFCVYTLQELQYFLPKNDDISNFCSNFSMGVLWEFLKIFSSFQEKWWYSKGIYNGIYISKDICVMRRHSKIYFSFGQIF